MGSAADRRTDVAQAMAAVPVRVRRVRAQDSPLLDAFVQALSPTSRQQRFHAGIRALPAAWLERMTHPDVRRELALVATATIDGRELCIGEARYVHSDDIDPGREFALVVADGWQRWGIGKTLLRSLGCHAERHGVERLVGDVLRDNLPMIQLAQSLGYSVRRHPAEARLLRVERVLRVDSQDDASHCAGLLRATRAAEGLAFN